MITTNIFRYYIRRRVFALLLGYIAVVGVYVGSASAESALELAAYRLRQYQYATKGWDIGYTTNLVDLGYQLKYYTSPRKLVAGPEAQSNHIFYSYYYQEHGPINYQVVWTNFNYMASEPTAEEFIHAVGTLRPIVPVGYQLDHHSVMYQQRGTTCMNYCWLSCTDAWTQCVADFEDNTPTTRSWPASGVEYIQRLTSQLYHPAYFPGLYDYGWIGVIYSDYTDVMIGAPTNRFYGSQNTRILRYIVGTLGTVPPGGQIKYFAPPLGDPEQPECPPDENYSSGKTRVVLANTDLFAEIEDLSDDECGGGNSLAPCSGGACGAGIPQVSINKYTLDVVIQDSPLWIDSPVGPSLEIATSFSSSGGAITGGIFGREWTCSYESRVVDYGGAGAKRIIMPSGSVIQFFSDGLTNGVYRYSGPPSSPYTLLGYTNGTYRLQHEEGGGYGFLATNSIGVGKLSYIEDRYGRRLSLSYSNGVLTNAVDAIGNTLDIIYDEFGRVSIVTNSHGVYALFGYTNDLLSTVVDMAGNAYSYQYETGALPIITSIQTVAGNIMIERGNELMSVKVTDPSGGVRLRGASPDDPLVRYEVNARGFTNWVYYTNTLAGLRIAEEVDALGNATTHHYDLLGRKVKTIDPIGRATIYAYDDNDNVITRVDPLGYTNTFVYAPGTHDLLIAIDPLGNHTAYAYDLDHNLVSITNALFGVSAVEYTNGVKLLEEDPNGLVTYYAYDEAFRVTQTVNSVGRTNIYSYDALSRVVAERNPAGLWVENAYDNLNRLIERVYPDGTKESFVYSCCGLVAETNRLGHVTTHAYDAVGRRVATTTPLGNTMTYQLDAGGNILVESNSLGHIIRIEYDALDRPVSRTFESQAGPIYTEAFAYDSVGRITNAVNRRGYSTVYQYDLLDRRTATLSGSGSTIQSSAYDALGRIMIERGPDGVVMTNEYDALGRLTRRWSPDGSNSENFYSYSSNGLYATRDQAGEYTIYVRDEMGRVTKSIDPLGRTIGYEYDPAGRLVALADGNENITHFQYDEYGNMVLKIYADTSVWTYAYDANNSLTNKVRANGDSVRYSYGPEGTLTGIMATDVVIYLSYDILGRITNRIDAVGSTVLSYGSGIHLESVDGPFQNDAITYTYDGDLKASVSLNGTQLIEYVWDEMDRLLSLSNQEGAFEYAYDGAGRLPVHIQYASGADAVLGYDLLGRIRSVSNRFASGGVISSHVYDYDVAGNRSRETLLDGSYIEYGYDFVGQLTSAIKKTSGGTPLPGYGFAYAYDPAGNMLTNVENGLIVAMRYNSLNQLTARTWGEAPTGVVVWGSASAVVTSVAVNAGATVLRPDDTYVAGGVKIEPGVNVIVATGHDLYGRTIATTSRVVVLSEREFSYDADGNMTGDGYFTNSWDALDRLVCYQRAATRLEYVYDGIGRRVEKREIEAGVTNVTRYVWDNWLQLAVLDENDELMEVNTWGLDLGASLEGAGGIGGLLSVQRTSDAAPVYEQFGDGRGNIVCQVAEGTNLVAFYEYSPFGTMLVNSGTEGGRYRFSSKEFDEKSRQYYFGYRFYSPNIERWFNRDPIEESGGINIYAYCENQPIDTYDSLGLMACCCNGEKIESKLKGTTVYRCHRPASFRPLRVYHDWVTIGASGWGYYSKNTSMPIWSGQVVGESFDADMCKEVKLDPCKYNFEKFRKAVDDYWKALNAKPGIYIAGINDCTTHANASIKTALSRSKGCSSK